MNEQPFYHQTELQENVDGTPEEAKVRMLVAGACGDILADTIDIANNELLFTATRSCCLEVERALEDSGFKLSYHITAEPGDPADLM